MRLFSTVPIVLGLMTLPAWADDRTKDAGHSGPIDAALGRSPVALDVSHDGRWLVTANETSDSVSLIRTADGRVVDEIACGRHPADLAFCSDCRTVLVTGSWSGDVTIVKVDEDRLQCAGTIRVGFEPWGLAVSPDGRRAYVGLMATGEVAELDLLAQRVTRRIDAGAWPRYLTLSPDGSRLAVGSSGEGAIVVIDTETGERLYDEALSNGINIGHLLTSADGTSVYFPWMVYRTNPITEANIRRGWVLASRIGRVRLDGPAYREAISLDVPRKAVADPHGIAITRDEQRLVVSSSGTHELLVYRLPDLPFVGVGGPGDLIDRELESDRDRFDRIEVGGRPLGLHMAGDDRTVYVANYLRNSVQVVDIEAKHVVDEISLGGPAQPSLAREGMALFYDGRRSLDQWYSCHSCHQYGGVNSRPMDTMNDGSTMTLKTVLPLYHVSETGPWTWHGWQTSLADAIHKSMTSTMLGEAPTDHETHALLAYLETLESPPNPFRDPDDGGLSDAALRGKAIFEGPQAACAQCHHGPHLTDGAIHDVGLGSPDDHYQGYNTPSLRGVYRKTRLLHNGRARSLERVVGDLHRPENVAGEGNLSEQDLADLIEYLKSL
jgi:DNA-binding beta-propeller fold protein YncE